jgi:hypothetical protein
MKKRHKQPELIDEAAFERMFGFIISLKIEDDTRKITDEYFSLLIFLQQTKVDMNFVAATFAGITHRNIFDNDLFYKLVFALKEENHDGIANILEDQYKTALQLAQYA